MNISVIIPTYNPNIERLSQTLIGLRNQTLHTDYWELILIDNNSTFEFTNSIDITWHPNSKIIKEPNSGLTYARLKGFKESKNEIIIMVDDDNILNENYLSDAIKILETNTQIGALGGKSIPLFESIPPDWLDEFYGNLALRDLGEQIIKEKWEGNYPKAAPIGAGMVLRRQAIQSYVHKIQSTSSSITDRKGNSLSSGGDNDLVIELMKAGWMVGYFPSLSLIHIIPESRTEVSYLARLVSDTNKSWIKLLESHQINPWNRISEWTVPIRKIKAWFTYKAWQSNVNFIKWKGACGMFDALGRIN